jgi:hypothetical protein
MFEYMCFLSIYVSDGPQYMSSLSYLADCSLSEEMSQFDFSTGVQSYSYNSQDSNSTTSHFRTLVTIFPILKEYYQSLHPVVHRERRFFLSSPWRIVLIWRIFQDLSPSISSCRFSTGKKSWGLESRWRNILT